MRPFGYKADLVELASLLLTMTCNYLAESKVKFRLPEYPKEEEFNDPVRYKAAIKHTLAQINSGCWNGMINGWNKNA